jgi:hypothetical protein
MGCYLEDYCVHVGNWAVRMSWLTAPGHATATRVASFLGSTILCAAVLATLLVIGGLEQNPGPGVEGENIVQVLCSGCDRISKSGKQCETCGRWFHNGCGNVKDQVAENRKWNCDRCRSERLRLLQEELQNALLQIEELKCKNKALGDQLRKTGAGKEVDIRNTESEKHEGEKCLVLGDSIVRLLGRKHISMTIECFSGIRTEQLHTRRVIENKNIGCPDTVIIRVGTNDLKRKRNLEYVMKEVYDLVAMAKNKFPRSRLVLSGVLRSRDVTWRRIGSINDRHN